MPKLCSTIAAIAAAAVTAGYCASYGFAVETIGPPAVKVGTSEADFFETKIRPLFAARCKECHGEKKQEMGLRVDRREAFFRGGDDGPVVMLGEPEKSRLIAAVRHQGDIQMPPDVKLPEDEITALITWVKLGAPWPEDLHAEPIDASNKPSDARNHWAFQRVQRPAIPEVKNAGSVRSPIDRFILAKLETVGLEPSPVADRRTLIRRATFDLLGLPPTPEEVKTFVADPSPNAYEQLVNRLLGSPHYGERWGRYWLDLARYSDTKGYVFAEDRNYSHAYLYRDWVVRAINEDLPYDQFLLQQMAADRLPQTDGSSLAAMGFLTLGRRFLNNKHDIIDDRLDVVFRSTQGLTISCARCHDHKYDPIPTDDYYSLYGVFDNSVEKTVPLETPSEAFRAELTIREMALNEYVTAERTKVLATAKARTAEYLLKANSHQEKVNLKQFAPADAELQPDLLTRWRTYLEGPAKELPHLWRPWNELAAAASGEEFEKKLTTILETRPNQPPDINRLLLEELQQKQPKSLDELAKCYAAALQRADDEWTREVKSAKDGAAPKRLADADAEQLRQIYHGKDSPLELTNIDFNSGPVKKRIDELNAEIVKWSTSDQAPRQAYVLNDGPAQSETRILVRGNPGNLGKTVPKQFPGIVVGPERVVFQDGSGRLEMAKTIASPTNPLTARVIVNRVWMYHFAAPLVDTPSDFGTRCDPPTHPELLDFLATEFVVDGWSLKKLHRKLMLSASYQQVSFDRPDCEAVDPTNRLLWKMNRRRLDWEALRDSIAFVSGSLDLTVGGKAFDLFAQPFIMRRTIYGSIDRQNLPGVLRTFDFALPDTHSPRRFSTIVPPQALYLMNNAFVVEQAQRVFGRQEIASEDETACIQKLYSAVLGRPATEQEVKLAHLFLASQVKANDTKPEETKLNAWNRFAQALLMINEFAFVD